MRDEGKFAYGAAVLQLIRDRADQDNGLRPGSLARIRIAGGVVMLLLGLIALTIWLIRTAPVYPDSVRADATPLVAVSGVGVIVGVALIHANLAPASAHRVYRIVQKAFAGVTYAGGVVGVLVAAAVAALIVYSLIAAPDSLTGERFAEILPTLLPPGIMALLALTVGKPILSITGRSGASSVIVRVWMAAATLAGVVATAVLAASTDSSLGELLPSALAVTAGAAIMRWPVSFRRRVDAIQRDVAERLTDVSLAAERASLADGSKAIATERAQAEIELVEALMRLENTITPANEGRRLVAVTRADSDVLALVGYLIERIHSRHPELSSDPRLALLDNMSDAELLRVTQAVSETLRWNLLVPRRYKLTQVKGAPEVSPSPGTTPKAPASTTQGSSPMSVTPSTSSQQPRQRTPTGRTIGS